MQSFPKDFIISHTVKRYRCVSEMGKAFPVILGVQYRTIVGHLLQEDSGARRIAHWFPMPPVTNALLFVYYRGT